MQDVAEVSRSSHRHRHRCLMETTRCRWIEFAKLLRHNEIPMLMTGLSNWFWISARTFQEKAYQKLWMQWHADGGRRLLLIM